MSTLAEIKSAATRLPVPDQQELLLSLVLSLRRDGLPLPEPRSYSREQMDAWIVEDEDDFRRFKRGE